MMKPGIDNLDNRTYPGNFSYQNCFGGPTSKDGPIKLNEEPSNVLQLLTGDNFNTNPTITKATFKPPYNEVVDGNSPHHHPIIRIPTSGSSYLYDEDCDTGNHLSYVDTVDAIIQYFTSNEVAVSFDLHWKLSHILFTVQNLSAQTKHQKLPRSNQIGKLSKRTNRTNGNSKIWTIPRSRCILGQCLCKICWFVCTL